jgi:ABC-2 type transport system ATP-binding protein
LGAPAGSAGTIRVVGAAIEVSGLTKRFGSRVALDSLDLTVPEGVAYGFLGPNGAGKTTLIRVLLGLTRPNQGEIRLLDQPMPQGRSDALSRTGSLVEEPRFHPHLTGRENLRIIAAARGPEAFNRIEGALATVGLTDRANERVKQYSLGMRQRLGVARSLLADPGLLILDEPSNGLDPAGIHEFRSMIRGFVGEGRTVFLSSHILSEVERICDRVAIVDRGRLVAEGTLDELRSGGGNRLVVGASDPRRALRLLAGHPAVLSADIDEDLLSIDLRPEAEEQAAAAAINRALVEAGIDVHRLEPVEASLEQRFLEITSRLGEESA